MRAPHPELALRFIDFMLAGENAVESTNLIGTANLAASKFIAADPTIFTDQAAAQRLEQLRELDRRQRRLLGRLWTEIKLW